MIQIQFCQDAKALERALAVRRAAEEASCLPDGRDHSALHALLTLDGQDIGAGRIRHEGQAWWVECVVVLPPFRGKRFGDMLFRTLLHKAAGSGGQAGVRLKGAQWARYLGQFGLIRQPDGSWMARAEQIVWPASCRK